MGLRLGPLGPYGLRVESARPALVLAGGLTLRNVLRLAFLEQGPLKLRDRAQNTYEELLVGPCGVDLGLLGGSKAHALGA